MNHAEANELIEKLVSAAVAPTARGTVNELTELIEQVVLEMVRNDLREHLAEDGLPWWEPRPIETAPTGESVLVLHERRNKWECTCFGTCYHDRTNPYAFRYWCYPPPLPKPKRSVSELIDEGWEELRHLLPGLRAIKLQSVIRDVAGKWHWLRENAYMGKVDPVPKAWDLLPDDVTEIPLPGDD